MLSILASVIRVELCTCTRVGYLTDTVMRSLLTRTVLLAFVSPFCCNDTTPDCNLPTKEVLQCNYSWELCLFFSDYSWKLEDTYYSQIIPGKPILPATRWMGAGSNESGDLAQYAESACWLWYSEAEGRSKETCLASQEDTEVSCYSSNSYNRWIAVEIILISVTIPLLL